MNKKAKKGKDTKR